MSVVVTGWGVVSPAGWGKESFRQACSAGVALPSKDLARPGQTAPLRVRGVPPLLKRPEFITHARLRRTSPISQYVVAAALEALGPDAALVQQGKLNLGIVLCATCGCVNYSRRFYDEAWKNPPTASPLLFPETVFNAPASHLAALLGTTAITYTLVGDPANYLAGIAVAAHWLREARVQRCLVIGAEENDWLTADAARLFSPDMVLSEGAGAICLSRSSSDLTPACTAEVLAVTDPHPFRSASERLVAARSVREQLACVNGEFLCDSQQGVKTADAAEELAWAGWSGTTSSPKRVLGEGLAAAAAWQCLCAIDALQDPAFQSSIVSVTGTNQQAIGAKFGRVP